MGPSVCKTTGCESTYNNGSRTVKVFLKHEGEESPNQFEVDDEAISKWLETYAEEKKTLGGKFSVRLGDAGLESEAQDFLPFDYDLVIKEGRIFSKTNPRHDFILPLAEDHRTPTLAEKQPGLPSFAEISQEKPTVRGRSKERSVVVKPKEESEVHTSSPVKSERPTAPSTDDVLKDHGLSEFVQSVQSDQKEKFSKEVVAAIKKYNTSDKGIDEAVALYNELDAALASFTGEPENTGAHWKGFQTIVAKIGEKDKKSQAWLMDIATTRGATVEQLEKYLANEKFPKGRRDLAQVELDRRKNSEVVKLYASGAAARSQTALREVEAARGFLKEGKVKEAAEVLSRRYSQLRAPVRDQLLKDTIAMAERPGVSPSDKEYLRNVAGSLRATNDYWAMREAGKDHATAVKETMAGLKTEKLDEKTSKVASETLAALGGRLDQNKTVVQWLDNAFDSSKNQDERAAALRKVQEAYKGGEAAIYDYQAQLARMLKDENLDPAYRAHLQKRFNQWAAVLGRVDKDGNWYLPVQSDGAATQLANGVTVPSKKPAVIIAASADDLGGIMAKMNGKGRGLERFHAPSGVGYTAVDKYYEPPKENHYYTYNAGDFKPTGYDAFVKSQAELAAKKAEEARKIAAKKEEERVSSEQIAQARQKQQPTLAGATGTPRLGAAGQPVQQSAAREPATRQPVTVVLYTSDGTWRCDGCVNLKNSSTFQRFAREAAAKGINFQTRGQPHYTNRNFYSPKGLGVPSIEVDGEAFGYDQIEAQLKSLLSR